MAKRTKPPARKGGAKKTAPPMRRKSKRASALPHVDLTAPKRKPIPAQVADGELRSVTQKAFRPGLNTAAAAHQRHNPRAAAFTPEHPTVEEQFDTSDRYRYATMDKKLPEPKPGLWARFRSAISGRWVTRVFARAHPDTTVREKVRQ